MGRTKKQTTEVTFAEVLGGVIHAFRKKQKASQRVFAERAGITQAMLSRIERGACDVSVETLWQIYEGHGLVPSSVLRAAETIWDQLE
ncbi:MAG: helix-turn-helix transcriptional regulator [bacterium]|nr:helix-turn-helix transcriptional regulator [bacterium]